MKITLITIGIIFIPVITYLSYLIVRTNIIVIKLLKEYIEKLKKIK